MEWKYIRTHRSWEDWLAIGLGVAIALAPWIIGETSDARVVANATLAGLVVLFLAELDLVRLRRWVEIGQISCGIWIAISPYIFGYSGGALRNWHLSAGLVLAVLGCLELWQRRTPP